MELNNDNSDILASMPGNAYTEEFSDYEVLPHSTQSFTCLVKAKRYGKWYILKCVKPEYKDQPVCVELLNKEFEILISLDHPNIVHGFGKENDKRYGNCIVMEYIDGVTLKEFMKRHAPDKKLIGKICRELVEAMVYYHNKQIIHRDLKPDNILVTHNGNNVKIIDFGLSDTDYHDVLKQPAGTLRYAAPEQKTSATVIDGRADIFAFGMILIELFAGAADIKFLSVLPQPYRSIARKCTQTNRDDRYPTANELLDWLKRAPNRNPVVQIITLILLSIIAGGMLIFNLSEKGVETVPEQPVVAEQKKETPTGSVQHITPSLLPESKASEKPALKKSSLPEVEQQPDNTGIIGSAASAHISEPEPKKRDEVTTDADLKKELMNRLRVEFEQSYQSITGTHYEKIIPLEFYSVNYLSRLKDDRRKILSSLQKEAAADPLLQYELKNYAEYIAAEYDSQFKKEHKIRKDSLKYVQYVSEERKAKSTARIKNSIDYHLNPDATSPKIQEDVKQGGWQIEKGKLLVKKMQSPFEKAQKQMQNAKEFSEQTKILHKYLEAVFKVELELRSGLTEREDIATLQLGFYKLYNHQQMILLKDTGLQLNGTMGNDIYLQLPKDKRGTLGQLIFTIPQEMYVVSL